MKLGRLNRLFDEDCALTDQMAKIVEKENEEGQEMRATIDRFIQGYVKLDPAQGMKLEAAINGLITVTAEAYLSCGFAIGQGFDITDKEAVEEVNGMKRKIKEGGFLRLWIKNNVATLHPAKVEVAATR